MTQLSPAVAQAAEHFGLDTARLRCLGGNSGSSWDAGDHVLRTGTRAGMEAELAAAAAASAVLPVPRVIARANAAAGDPLLDRARTWTILTLDPAARARQAQPAWRALTSGWSESGDLRDLPATSRAWACRLMLTDLARRYSADDLKHVSHALRRADAATGDTPP